MYMQVCFKEIRIIVTAVCENTHFLLTVVSPHCMQIEAKCICCMNVTDRIQYLVIKSSRLQVVS